MDVAICQIDHKAKTLSYAGAKNPLLIIKDGVSTLVKGSKSAIGDLHKTSSTFELHTFKLSEIDAAYMYSDGYQDQFGGKNKRKFLPKNLKEMLVNIHKQPTLKQEEVLENTLTNWIDEGKQSQIDDILIIGLNFMN